MSLSRNKKGIEAFVFIFSVLILVIIMLIFILGLNLVKTPETVIKTTVEHSDAKLLIHSVLKHDISYQESVLTVQEAFFLYSENNDPELEKKIYDELDKFIVQLYEEPCWELSMEKDGEYYYIDNFGFMSRAKCLIKSTRVDVDILAPSRRGILMYNLVIEE